MAQVKFLERDLEWRDGESLLDCLERQGADIPSSCRSGACHSCLVRVTAGPISPVAQLGLKDSWKAQGMALSCMSTEPVDITVAPSDLSVQVAAIVEDKRALGRDVVRLKLRPGAPFPFRAGQYVNLTRSDGLTRSYSIASVETDGVVELHVRVVAGGRMSQWVQSTLRTGDEVSIRGPTGDCIYVEGRADQPLVLVGTGTGLAPLVGIARDALSRKHRGSITLIHGGRAAEDLYLDLEMRKLAKQHANFRYLPTLSGAEAVPGTQQGRVDAVMRAQFPDMTGFRVFLCGSPAMVKDARALAYKLGASLNDILADSFIAAPPPKEVKAETHALPVITSAPKKKFEVKTGVPRLQKLRFAVQAAIFSGFLLQGALYYLVKFRPVGSLLPFMAYDSLGHLVMSSTLVIWATMFALVFVLGRFACGWLCPLGFIQDAGEKVLRALKITVRKPVRQSNTIRFLTAFMVLGHFVVMPILAAPVRLWQLDWLYREPWLLGFPFRAGLFALDLLALFVVLGLVLPYFFGPRPYCKLVCETGYLFDLTSRFSFGRIRRNEGFERDTCLNCQRCSNICPQGINVFEEVHLFDRVVSGGCISCMQCVNTCPNDTIVYSLRKKATDTSRVTGYLAALQTRGEDLPRYALTGLGVAAGGAFGFLVLPPSYFHTYALLASLGGLTGFLVWRAITTLFAAQLEPLFAGAPVSQVEKEKAARIVPLTPEERMGSQGSTAVGTPKKVLAVALAMTLVSGIAVAALASHVPARIGTLDEIPSNLTTVEQRAAAKTFSFGVPTETSAEQTQSTYAGLRDVFKGVVADDARIWRAESYGALAWAVEHGKVDAAFLPGASAYSLLKRTHMKVEVLAQAQHDGATTYTGLLVARKGFNASGEGLFGARVAFVQPDSLSGYLAPVQWLKTRGVRLSDLGEVIFSGTHARSLSLLQSQRVDIAATFDSTITALPERDELQVLARFEDLPNTLLISRPGLEVEQQKQILEALQKIWASTEFSEEREALAKGAAIDGLVPASVDGVQSVEHWLGD